VQEKLKKKLSRCVIGKLPRKGRPSDFLSMPSANKNDDPKLLMEVGRWWILPHKLDHFEKATKIKRVVLEIEKTDW
jgi:Family of unknown function (DUF6500)